MSECPDCFKEQGTLNEKLQQAIKDAQVLANIEKVKVAVIATGRNFTTEIITGAIPAGCCKVVNPL